MDAHAVGEPQEALSTFAQTAVKWSAAAAPDPKVATAVALGWRVGEALTWAAAGEQRRPAGVCDLALDDSARWAVLMGQVARMRHALGAPPHSAGNGAATVKPAAGVPAPLAAERPPATTPAEVVAFRAALLESLYVVDDALGEG